MRGSRNFRQGGGGGGPGPSGIKSSDNVFLFFSPQLILQKSSGYFQRKLSFLPRFQWGWNIFRGGGGGGGERGGGGGGPTFFPVGSNCIFPYRSPYNL